MALSQAMIKLVSRSGQILTEAFTRLDRRLKSADKKERTIPSLVTGGRPGRDVQRRKRRDQNRPRVSETVVCPSVPEVIF